MMRTVAVILLALVLVAAPALAADGGRGGGRGVGRGGGSPRLSFSGRGRGGHHHGHHHHYGGPRFSFYGSYGPWWYPYPYYRPYFYPYPYAYYPAYPYYAPPSWVADTDDDDDDADDRDASPPDMERASYGLVKLDGVRDGAAVELDGRFWLTADDLDDRWLALPEGEHRIAVRVREGETVERVVRIVPGRTHVLKFDARDHERPT